MTFIDVTKTFTKTWNSRKFLNVTITLQLPINLLDKKCHNNLFTSIYLDRTKSSINIAIVYAREIWLDITLPKAVGGKCSVKKMFLKVSQHSQKNTCVGISFQYSCRPESLTIFAQKVHYRCLTFLNVQLNQIIFKSYIFTYS